MARKDQGFIVASGTVETTEDGKVYKGTWTVERIGKATPVLPVTQTESPCRIRFPK
jgi:hypothetical protein